MVLTISDRFYEPHSFAIDFGHSSKQEIEHIREVLSQKGFAVTDSNVKSVLLFVRDISTIIRDKNKDEITNILKITKEEKITGGFLPPDISIAYHSFSHLMDAVIYGLAGKELIQVARNDKIARILNKAFSKLKRTTKGKIIINKQLQKMKRWKKQQKTTVKKPHKQKLQRSNTKKKKTVKRK
ncbi:MAG: hypothetical protein ACREA8_09645 [Nitrosotalea sp.]